MLYLMAGCVPVVMALVYARQVARFLRSFDAARVAFGQEWRSRPAREQREAEAAARSLDPVQGDAVAALAGLGMSRKQARQAVKTAIALHPGADVETLVRRCVHHGPSERR